MLICKLVTIQGKNLRQLDLKFQSSCTYIYMRVFNAVHSLKSASGLYQLQSVKSRKIHTKFEIFSHVKSNKDIVSNKKQSFLKLFRSVFKFL